MRGHAHRRSLLLAAPSLALLVLLPFALAVCGGNDGSTATPTEAAATPTEAALPTWAPDASPSPACTVTERTGTTEGLEDAALDGIDFTPRVDIEVSALGYFDGDGDGLRHSHKVAIFDRVSKEEVVSAVVDTDSPLEGVFRWVSVEPAILEAGRTYDVAGECGPPLDEEMSGEGAWAPELDPSRCWSDVTWQCPTVSKDGLWVAPNFKFKPVTWVKVFTWKGGGRHEFIATSKKFKLEGGTQRVDMVTEDVQGDVTYPKNGWTIESATLTKRFECRERKMSDSTTLYLSGGTYHLVSDTVDITWKVTIYEKR